MPPNQPLNQPTDMVVLNDEPITRTEYDRMVQTAQELLSRSRDKDVTYEQSEQDRQALQVLLNDISTASNNNASNNNVPNNTPILPIEEKQIVQLVEKVLKKHLLARPKGGWGKFILTMAVNIGIWTLLKWIISWIWAYIVKAAVVALAVVGGVPAICIAGVAAVIGGTIYLMSGAEKKKKKLT